MFTNKFWRIAFHEYSRHVFRKRFLFVLLSLPLILLVYSLMVALVVWVEFDLTPVGYIDHSLLLSNEIPSAIPFHSITPLVPFTNEMEAKAALESKDIQAYFVIEADFLKTGNASVVYLEEPKGIAINEFKQFLKAHLLTGLPNARVNRLWDGSHISVHSLDESRQFSVQELFNFLLPFALGFGFFITILNCSGYLLQAVIEEKENRTMEVIVTSVSPGQFMSGKIAADISIGLTQLIVWGLFAIAGIVIAIYFFPSLRHIQMNFATVIMILAVMAPALIMYSALMAAIGSMVTEGSESSQMVGFLTLPMWLPLMLGFSLFRNPNSILAHILTFFPLTAPLTVVLRIGLTQVPVWQIILSASILTLCAIGALWLAGRTFRLGMLRYGKPLRLREVFHRRSIT